MSARGQFDDKTKTETVRKILAGEMTMQEAMRRYEIQSYQLHAWIGYAVMEQASRTKAAPADVVRKMAEPVPASTPPPPPSIPFTDPGSVALSLSERRATVEWYIKHILLPESQPKGSGGSKAPK